MPFAGHTLELMGAAVVEFEFRLDVKVPEIGWYRALLRLLALRGDRKEVPFAGHALELVGAAVVELEA